MLQLTIAARETDYIRRVADYMRESPYGRDWRMTGISSAAALKQYLIGGHPVDMLLIQPWLLQEADSHGTGIPKALLVRRPGEAQGLANAEGLMEVLQYQSLPRLFRQLSEVRGGWGGSIMRLGRGQSNRTAIIGVYSASGGIGVTATVAVMPEAEEIDIEIRPEDIRIDTMRASGAGGQHVNTTDSAVRITHNPTGIVVACQQERSQHKNRATAWNMLRARLYEAELKKREEKANAEAASKTEIGWGHQIRSYVLQPYQLVKDLRTGTQSTDPDEVLDGDLDPFMEASLAQRVYGGSEEVADID